MVVFLLGAWAWRRTGDPRWLFFAIVLLANRPYTLLGIMPTIDRLMALYPAGGWPESRRLIERWGKLHAVRSALGLAATAMFFWASLRQG